MNEALVNLINEWDPVGLFPMAPKDEYYAEILSIQELLSNNTDLDVNILANMIHEIFINAFGEDTYTVCSDDCILIAGKIIELMKHD